MVSCPPRHRAAESDRLCEWRKRALPGCQRIERPCSRISWPLGRRGLWRLFRQPSRDAHAIKCHDTSSGFADCFAKVQAWPAPEEWLFGYREPVHLNLEEMIDANAVDAV